MDFIFQVKWQLNIPREFTCNFMIIARLGLKGNYHEKKCAKLIFGRMPLASNKSRQHSKKFPEATSLDWKSQCLANPSVSLIRLADEKSKRN
jgi:hypothetical protein